MTNQNDYYEDELSLLDIYKVLKAYWQSIVVTPFALALFALVFTWLFVTPKYEAQGVIDIGRVNQALLETPDILVDRLNQPAFINRVVEEHPHIFKEKTELTKKEHYNSFVAKKNKDSNLVSFVLKGKSNERAQAKASAVIETLAGIHRKIFENNVELVKQQITLIDHQIEALKADQIPNGVSSKDAYDSVLKALIFNDHVNQLRTLMNRKLELEASLSSVASYNTRLLERVYVSDEPVSPNLLIVTLVAFLLGLFGAVFAAFVRNSLKA